MGLATTMQALALVFILFAVNSVQSDHCAVADDSRFDCYPENFATKDKCVARGCCWVPAAGRPNPKMRAGLNVSNLDTPYCFYPSDFGGYKVSGIKDTDMGFMLTLELNGRGGPYPNNYKEIVVDVSMETETRLRVTVSLKCKNSPFCVPGHWYQDFD